MATFFEHKRPRQFEYKPRFYDPKKEQLEQLKAKYGENNGETYNRRINFRKAMEEQKKDKIGAPISMSKILLFACIIVCLVYVLCEIVLKWA
ncbi:MAG: hypothetical protein HUK18_03960 [Bacteroidales bacterium]|nr:hypothetical protein [Bacteroidales bacterium]